MLRSRKDIANAPEALAQGGSTTSDGKTVTDGEAPSHVVGGRPTGEHGPVTFNRHEVVSGHEVATSNGHGQRQRPVSASGRHIPRQVKLVAGLLALAAVILWGAMAVMYYHFDVVVFGFYRRRAGMDSGAGTLWIPPEERPVPLSAFPDFSGSGLNNPKGLSRAGDIGNGARTGVAAGGRPPTLLFMHLWKCAGSSLRHLLRDWAELEDRSIAIVVKCNDVVSKVRLLAFSWRA